MQKICPLFCAFAASLLFSAVIGVRSDKGILCGTINQNGLGKIPWAMALYHKGQYFGGGSLVTPGLVLTAAHIVLGKSAGDIKARAGVRDLLSGERGFLVEDRQVVKIISHEAFDYISGGNNLALLFLDSPFELKAHIATICLPRSSEQKFAGRSCAVFGWGKRAFPDDQPMLTPQKIDLPIVEDAQCQEQLRRTTLGPNFLLPANVLCAGDRDACSLFGGSPLFCSLEQDPLRFEQVGIASWGMGCGQENVPAVYTNVAKLSDWIAPHLQQVLSIPGDLVNSMLSEPRT
ncbi:phenoloxidase-activating factor 2 [Drosophila ficusphila]|uniref:phenoloxidase-activating factor 2 n=1 Tax=Drosophila ficusphila TaxID=30025 RepID=UPI001C8A9AB5|nr:phenoloxidase-activating factor 2 [Drosophila ficusphila]